MVTLTREKLKRGTDTCTCTTCSRRLLLWLRCCRWWKLLLVQPRCVIGILLLLTFVVLQWTTTTTTKSYDSSTVVVTLQTPREKSITTTTVDIDRKGQQERISNSVGTTTGTGGDGDHQIISEPSSPVPAQQQQSIMNRWESKFGGSSSSPSSTTTTGHNTTTRRSRGGYVFFKHMRKAGGTSVRDFLIQVMMYHHNNNNKTLDDVEGTSSTSRASSSSSSSSNFVAYTEQEFHVMDSTCPTLLDKERWKQTLSVVVLRHPIERQLSEFFYMGPGRSNSTLKELQKTKDFTSKQYENFIKELLPSWINKCTIKGLDNGGTIDKSCFLSIGKFTDNYQVRALTGIGGLERRGRNDNDNDEENDDDITNLASIIESTLSQREEWKKQVSRRRRRKGLSSLVDLPPFNGTPYYNCTAYYQGQNVTIKRDDRTGEISAVDKILKPNQICGSICNHIYNGNGNGCDGVCLGGIPYYGKLSEKFLQRAKDTLKQFDLVLLMESMTNDLEQIEFLTDFMGISSIQVTQSFLGWKNVIHSSGGGGGGGGAQQQQHQGRSSSVNSVVQEQQNRYQNIIRRLPGGQDILNLLLNHSSYEMELYNYAIQLNKQSIDQWKIEKEQKETS